ncbi:Hexamerin [Harpegnathos saltator]|uniref:Hexamerin n=1 Tax=Harpegnathos saltator TaxID=610380 RepID=E2BPJ8_HARSA|nr:Hexamerin [Harpegnathos saltator]
MKAVVLFLAAACLAHATEVPQRTATKQYLVKQKNIYELFAHVDQPTVYHPELYQKARAFSIEDNISSYNDQAVVTEFLQRFKNGMLPRGEVFSMMYPLHLAEMICLFRLFYTAKDFDTFYNTAVFARFHMNEHMYIHALTNAVLHRQDTNTLRIPPLYEIIPYVFMNEDVLHKAYHIAMGNTGIVGVKKTTVGSVDTFYIPTNYTGSYIVRDEVPENQKLSYYHEDIGLNAYYFMSYHEFPSFMNSVEYNMPQNVRGEMFMYLHKQMLLRYYLERLSNNIGEIDYIDVNKPIVTGYYPSMHYHNGVPFIQRPVNSEIPLHVHRYVQALQDFHTRISNAIDSGYLVDKNGKRTNIYESLDGLNQLCNVIHGNADSVNEKYYGNVEYMYRKILGFVPDPIDKYHVVPSSLHFVSTSMRDPAFYGIFKNIVTYLMRYKEHLPCYTHNDLVFPGVKIESVTVDKLTTFFDHFDSLVNNALSIPSQEKAHSMLIKARQYRLNHKPFTYHITVNSDKNTKASVRIFLGPKYDVHGHELDISENYMNFLEMDQYKEHLPCYTHNDLVFPGVKIESVTVDKLTTFFDHFDSLVNNALSIPSQEKAHSMLIKARQYRLNHKPFTYHITVNSDKNTKASVRIFLGPKYDVHGHELDISENYMNFLEMDQFIVDLKPGTNKIERNSYESVYVVPDEVPSDVLYKKILKAIESDETFTYPSQPYGFPDRLQLPKGKKEGLPLKLFVCVTAFDETKSFKIRSPVRGPSVLDGRPLGYPLDRHVHSFNFTVPNFHMRDVLVYHRHAEELNLTV